MKIYDLDELTVGDLVPSEWDVFILRSDPLNPTRRTVAVNRGTYVDTYELEDVAALIEENARFQREFSRTSAHGDVVRTHSVPGVIAAQWRREGWDEADKKRWLNDPDNAKFRTTHNWRL